MFAKRVDDPQLITSLLKVGCFCLASQICFPNLQHFTPAPCVRIGVSLAPCISCRHQDLFGSLAHHRSSPYT